MIERYFKKGEEFVQDLYDQQHLVGFKGEDPNEDLENKDSKELSNQELLTRMNVDNNTRILYAKMLKLKTDDEEKGVETSLRDQEAINRKKAEVTTMISNAVSDYVHYCKNKMDVLGDLRKFGNEKYHKEKNKIDELRIKAPIRDGHYAHKFFDVLKWWEIIGAKRWPCLSNAAAIILGKPSHNGFQERVFSRGTYFDDPLKQRLKEENFEKSVLNSLNQEKIKDLMELIPKIKVPEQKYEVGRQQMNSFFKKENEVKNIFSFKTDTDEEVEAIIDDDDNDEIVSVSEDEAINDDSDDFDDLSIMTDLEKEDDILKEDRDDSTIS